MKLILGKNCEFAPGSTAEEPQLRVFCEYCGASIPHRPGEGRCPKCVHHRPAEEPIPPWEKEEGKPISKSPEVSER